MELFIKMWWGIAHGLFRYVLNTVAFFALLAVVMGKIDLVAAMDISARAVVWITAISTLLAGLVSLAIRLFIRFVNGMIDKN